MSNTKNVCVCPNCECQNGKPCTCGPSCGCKTTNAKKTTREGRLGRALMVAVLGAGLWTAGNASPAADHPLEYRVLATSQTSTMEKELNEAGAAGYRFSKAMGGQTAFGGHEIVVAVLKTASDSEVHQYKLLAASRTSTMEKELQGAANQGYEYLSQTVYETAFGGKEVVIILERNPARTGRQASYRLLATSKTSTMQKELKEAARQGYALLGLTVGKTAFGGDEIVAVLGKD
jgi:hypothetical protein